MRKTGALGDRLRDRRKEIGLNQADVAKEAGCSSQRLSQVEAGSKPSLKLLRNLCKIYDLDNVEMMRLIVKPQDAFSPEEMELIRLIRNRDDSRALRVFERLVYSAQP